GAAVGGLAVLIALETTLTVGRAGRDERRRGVAPRQRTAGDGGRVARVGQVDLPGVGLGRRATGARDLDGEGVRPGGQAAVGLGGGAGAERAAVDLARGRRDGAG